jgi:hypothetical protein
LHQLVRLPSPNAHVPPIEQRQYERVSEQVAKRQRAILAVDPDDPHKIRDHAHCRLRPEHLCVQRKLQRAGYLFVEGMGGVQACAPMLGCCNRRSVRA